MAVSITSSDVWGMRTGLTKGYGDVRADSAIRGFIVNGLEDDNESYLEAINAVKTDVGDFHQSVVTLPVFSISASKFGPNKARVSVSYRRNQASIPTQIADLLCQRRSGFDTVEWWRDESSYDADDRPSGDIRLVPADNLGGMLPRSYRWRFGILVMNMQTVLDTQPAASYLAYVGKVNSNDTGQWTAVGAFPAGTLYFAGWQSTPIEVDGGVKYLVNWQAIYNKHKWKKQLISWDSDGEEYVTALADAHPTVTFPTFPVHTVVT